MSYAVGICVKPIQYQCIYSSKCKLRLLGEFLIETIRMITKSGFIRNLIIIYIKKVRQKSLFLIC